LWGKGYFGGKTHNLLEDLALETQHSILGKRVLWGCTVSLLRHIIFFWGKGYFVGKTYILLEDLAFEAQPSILGKRGFMGGFAVPFCSYRGFWGGKPIFRFKI